MVSTTPPPLCALTARPVTAQISGARRISGPTSARQGSAAKSLPPASSGDQVQLHGAPAVTVAQSSARSANVSGTAATLASPVLAHPELQRVLREGSDVPSFTVQQDSNGHAHLISPDGTPFFITGLNVVRGWDDSGGPPGPRYDGTGDNGGDYDAWSKQTLRRMDEWNFNTIGPWSTLRGKPYTVEVPLSGWVMNVLDGNFEQSIRDHADEAEQRDDVGRFAHIDKDPNLIGYFTDNELNWGFGYSWRDPGVSSLFEAYAALKPDSEGKKGWANYMAQTYNNDFAKISSVWNVDVKNVGDLCAIAKIAPRSAANYDEADKVGDNFLRMVADKYYSTVNDVMREKLPHHLNLGSRITAHFPAPVAEMAGKYNDVVSVNVYSSDMDFFVGELERAHKASGKPILVTEFAFVARENRSGNDNHWYEGCEVETDKDRGNSFTSATARLSGLPYLVGYTWFQFFDEPTHGRGDTECSNFGFVDVNNKVYEDLATAATAANAANIAARTADTPHATRH